VSSAEHGAVNVSALAALRAQDAEHLDRDLVNEPYEVNVSPQVR